MNIFEIIKKETDKHRHLIAVVEGQDQICYGALIAAAEQVAESLRCEGVSRFHRVGLLCADGIDYIVTSLAILSLSAAIVPISPELTAEEIATVIDRIDVDFIVAEPRLLDPIKGTRAVTEIFPAEKGEQITSNVLKGETHRLPSADFIHKVFSITQRTVTKRPPTGYFTSNPAFIRFSSGTTGTSKGVVLSHEAIIDRTDAADRGMRVTSKDTVLWVLSMSYHFVVTILLFLRRGAKIVLCSHRFPEALIEGIIVHQGTFIYASPFHYNLLSRTDLLAGDSLKQVRMAISTAMKLPEQIAEAFSNKFGFELTEAYGIIEVGLPFIKMSGGRDKRGSVGRALPGFELRLDTRDEDGVGEIFIKGKGMLDAYFSPWQRREEILHSGWFRTGDLGKIDADGFLFIVGRDKDVINFAGMKIFAQEVESVINQHPRVKESLVYGIPHPQYGELPTAKVVLLDENADDDLLDNVRRFCYQKLAQYKVPKEFHPVDCLQKTASGKIKR
jgi:long-chain acyl-CoA synthetase